MPRGDGVKYERKVSFRMNFLFFEGIPYPYPKCYKGFHFGYEPKDGENHHSTSFKKLWGGGWVVGAFGL